jgi:uncharacterized membrane protein
MNNYIFLSFIIAFVWGISPVLFKYILNKHIPSYIIIFVQASVYLFSSIIYIYLYKYNEIYKDLQQNIKYMPFLIIISFFSVYIANVLYIFALEKKASVNIISIIVSLAPVITIISSYFILCEKISFKVLIGFLLIFIGLMYIFELL